jgi:hypothetical protein
VKLLERRSNGWVLQLNRDEAALLRASVSLYPLVPDAHAQLSRHGGPGLDMETQQLLNDALAENRRQTRARLRAWLEDAACWIPGGRGTRFLVRATDLEWLLQVVNDVRVGSWIRLGSPDADALRELQPDPTQLRSLVIMEWCGMFQSALLSLSDSGGGGNTGNAGANPTPPPAS